MSHSVYQSNGKPLSDQALYYHKLKYGVYNKPDQPSLGVNSNASDTAALLAASSDLSIKPYQRSTAAEAHSAATSAKSMYQSPSNDYLKGHTESNNAAASALTKTPGEHAREALGSIYSFDDYRSGSIASTSKINYGGLANQAKNNASMTMSSRTNPERDIRRSGLKSEPIKTSTLNIKKISSIANNNSAKTLDSRFNPGKDYRSGVASEKEIKSFTANEVVDKNLLSIAIARAQERLSSIESGGVKDYKSQAKLYAGALLIAQQNSEKRQKGYNLVDLGGGLTITQAELDALARQIVQPVLKDIDAKATEQRQADRAYAKQQQDLKKEHERHKQAVLQQELEDKRAREQAKVDRKAAHEDKKKQEEIALKDFEEAKNAEVEAKLKDMEAQRTEQETIKTELLEAKQAEIDRIKEEEDALIDGRKTVLTDMQAEKDELIKPTLDELAVESEKLATLTSTKKELTKEVDESSTENADLLAKLEALKAKLEETTTSIETTTAELEEATHKEAATGSELAEFTKESEAKLEELNAKHDEYDAELEKTAKEKEEAEAAKVDTRAQIETHLSEKIKDEHKINEELPEHLQLEVKEKKILDTSSVFTDYIAPIPTPEPVEETHVVESKEGSVDPLEVKPVAKTVKPALKPALKPKKEEKKKEGGFRRRLSSLFVGDIGSSKSKDVKLPKKTSVVKKSTASPTPVPETAAIDEGIASSKESAPVPKSERTFSGFSQGSVPLKDENEDFDDESLLNKSNKNVGLFKEEI